VALAWWSCLAAACNGKEKEAMSMRPKTRADIQAWIDSLMKRGGADANRNAVVTKQRCVNVGGQNIACVQDSATVQPHPFLLFGGLALLIWIAR